jgi:exopolysaccharide biosynthesis polyprenyl glycosylphosphotransferase
MIAALLVITLVSGWRLLLYWLDERVAPRERLLLVGTSDAAVTLARELHERRHELGVSIVGFVDPDPTRVGQPVVNPGVIGSVDDIPMIVRARGVDRVVVSLADARGKLPMNRLLEMKLGGGVTFDHLASVYEEYTGKIAVENLRPSWLIFSEGFKTSHVVEFLKRTLDVVCASLLFLILSPVMLIVAALVRLTSPGPALYHQKRVGRHGHVFYVHKFRSMRTDAESKTGAVWAQANDSRVTPIGRFLRRARLDEIPQLWNVLKGEMSLVGPRPEDPAFVELRSDAYSTILEVRPGITGLSQLAFASETEVLDADDRMGHYLDRILPQKIGMDSLYAKQRTLGMDLKVLWWTARAVVGGSDVAVNRESGRLTPRAPRTAPLEEPVSALLLEQKAS